MGIFFIKLPKHYVFDYKPLYYDPKKEEREKRFRQIDEKLGLKKEEDKGENYRPEIWFRRMYSYHRRSKQFSLFRLIIVLGLMMVITYLLLNSEIFEKFFEYLTN
jgi:hypothetical protein